MATAILKQELPVEPKLPRLHRFTVEQYLKMVETGILGPDDHVWKADREAIRAGKLDEFDELIDGRGEETLQTLPSPGKGKESPPVPISWLLRFDPANGRPLELFP